MFRKKIISSFLISLMLLGCAGASGQKANNTFLAPTSQLTSSDTVTPAIIGKYISSLLSSAKGRDLASLAEKIFDENIEDGIEIKSFPYKHAVYGVKSEMFGQNYIVIVSTKPLDTGIDFYKEKGSSVGVSFITEEEFNSNIQFSGSTNHVSKVRISRPLVYRDEALEKFTYNIPSSETSRETTTFVVAVQKASDVLQRDSSFKISKEILDAYNNDVIININKGHVVNDVQHYKSAYSVMIDLFNEMKADLSEEDAKDMMKYIHHVADKLSNVHLDAGQKLNEIYHCNSAFKDKQNFFKKIEDENPEFAGIGMILDEIRKHVVTVIEKYNFTFEYALYCTFKHAYMVDDAQFAMMLDAVAAAQPHVMKDVALSVDYMISKASKFIGSLPQNEISQELKDAEYAACSRVIDKMTTHIVTDSDILQLEDSEKIQAFSFVDTVRIQLTQVLSFGYKGAYLVGIEVENYIERLHERKEDLKKSGSDEIALARLDSLINVVERLGEEMLTDILGETEFSIEVPEEGFILFVDDMDAYVFSKFLEKYGSKQIRGIVAQQGTSTSHWVISAGQKDIPVILGPKQVYGTPQKDLYDMVENSDYVGIDGNTGVLIANLAGEKLGQWIEIKNWSDSVSEYFVSRVAEDTKIPLKIAANFDADLNISSVSDMELRRALNIAVGPIYDKYSIDKIGLVRTEYLYMLERMLTDKEMFSVYDYLSSADNAVTIRGFDYEADKDISAVDKLYKERGADKPRNLFGAKYYYQDPSGIGRELIKQQLKNVYKAYLSTKDSKLQFMFPMVSSKEDIDAMMAIKKEVLEELIADVTNPASKEFIAHIPAVDVPKILESMKVGSMVETVLAVRNIDKLNKAFDFTSIGTNDLTKSTFDVSRDEAGAEQYFDKLQPDLLSEIREVFDAAVRHQKPVSVCGELAKDPKFMLFALAQSAKYENPEETFFPYVGLSMSGVSIPQAKEILRTVYDNNLMSEITALFADLDNIDADTLDAQAKALDAKIKDIISAKDEVKALQQNIERDFAVRHPDLSHFIDSYSTISEFLQAA